MVVRQAASTGKTVDDDTRASMPLMFDNKPCMHVKIYSPFNVYFEGDAYNISGENATGPFDILPRHHNFIAILSPRELVVTSVNNGVSLIKVAGGIMHVKKDKVSVFLQV